MRKLVSIITALSASIVCAATVYVDCWPRTLAVADGMVFDPTAEQCRAAGFELRSNRPAEEIAAEAAAAATAASNAAVAAAEAESNAVVQSAAWQEQLSAQADKVAELRGRYYTATRALCADAGMEEVYVLTAAQLDEVVLLMTVDAVTDEMVRRNARIAAYLVQIEFLTLALEKEDGADALDRL